MRLVDLRLFALRLADLRLFALRLVDLRLVALRLVDLRLVKAPPFYVGINSKGSILGVDSTYWFTASNLFASIIFNAE